MTFYEVLEQVQALLQRHGRMSYRALKRQFALDDEYLEDLKAELVEVQGVAVDQDGTMLVWTGDAPVLSPPAAPALAQEQTPRAYTPVHLTEKILATRAALEGERKQVTVLFADLKGSTELIAGLDPEAARRLLDPALHAMMEAVHRYEGTVNQVLGDGIMALFGAPIAHEDHAVRACYAALVMHAAMQGYAEEVRRTQGLAVQMRVGLNSGVVVVRAIGNDLHMDYSAVGLTTVLAARMEQLATPGSILLTADTLRLVEGLVRVHALGPVPVKGMAEPVEAFELRGATALRGRLQAAAARGLTRFVGRQTELEALSQALARAGEGQGQVAAVVGEAGVGKSRLVYEFLRSHHTQGWLVLESASVSYGKATPYFPVIDLLKRYAHVEEHDDPRTVRSKTTGQVLTLDETLQDTIPALFALLDALPEDSPFLTLDPSQRRQRTLAALKRLLLRESQVQPLLLVFEDLHWIDTETQALLDSLTESLPTVRLLLLVNYRPEYQHGWGSKTYYTQLRLDPLPPASADELLQALLGNDPSLAPLKQLLIERTGGNPFFLEESVRALVETGVLVGERGAYRLATALPAVQVPATVQAVLTARIDRLPPEEKHLLQTAAVIGTEVPLALLQAIAEMPDEALRVGLAHLQAAEFLYETRLFPDLEYTFKHALTHEVAYGSILQERRRTLHAGIVEALERLAPERLAEQVDRLAHHAFRGEVWDKAVAYGRQAGAKALARSAYREAVTAFEQALTALQHLPENQDTLAQAIDLRFDLRLALVPLGEYGRIFDSLRDAERLAEALGDQRRLGWAAALMINFFHMRGDYEHGLASGQRARAIATALGDLALQVETHFHLGHVYHALGDYRQASDVLRWNVAALTGELLQERLSLPGLASVLSRNWLVRCLVELGAFAEGRVLGDEAIQMAETADHPFSRSEAYSSIGRLSLRQGDFPKAISTLERGLEVCQAANIRLFVPWLASDLGAAYALAGRLPEALPLLEQAMAQATAMGRLSHLSFWTVQLSAGYLLAGRLEDAMPLAQHALAHTRTHGERGHQAHALRLLGDVYAQLQSPDVEPATAHYREALVLAEELGMRPLLAHCYLGLGTLYAKTGQREQARAELSAAIELYRAMDMTFWLPRAEAALAEVK
jgi:class 3 adenylate cyclase/tetratricopeptide (TPR) repeat protein